MRTEEVYRKTKETEVKVCVNLDGEGKAVVNTSVPFLDHMLTSLATHSLIDITASVKGDLVHHCVEDLAIGLGEALNKALGSREGITRFGSAAAPMDCSFGMTINRYRHTCRRNGSQSPGGWASRPLSRRALATRRAWVLGSLCLCNTRRNALSRDSTT